METPYQIRDFDPELDADLLEKHEEFCNAGRGIVRAVAKTLRTGAAPSWGGPCGGSVKTVILSNGVKLPVQERIAELVALLSEETMRRGYKFVNGWCWGYACRKIRGTSKWSNHAWALAVDINAPKNPHKRPLTTDMPQWMWELWERFGFRWGGRYRKPDTMHYEYMGSTTDADRHTQQARQELRGQPPPPPPPPGDDRFRPWPGNPSREYGGYQKYEHSQRRDGNVEWIQTQLNGTGAGLVVDGKFGQKTHDAVVGFQSLNGLKADGIVGEKTWNALKGRG